MVACKMAAIAPERVASMSLISTTRHGWQMALGLMRLPLTSLQAGMSPNKRSSILANLRVNFSKRFLAEKVPEAGNRRRIAVMADNTQNAITLGLQNSHKFLAEGMESHARTGQTLATLYHRLTKKEIDGIKNARVPALFINGQNDRVARPGFVHSFAKALDGHLLLTDGAHAGIVIENLEDVVPALEVHILGERITPSEDCQRLGFETRRLALQLEPDLAL
eukprot:jgi/Botrbrau1/7062/Bobra.0165s0085.1